MKYNVPQFIDVEDKIFGPLTFRQFIYLVGGGGLAFLAYKLVPGFFGILAALPFVAIAIALAFVKINEKPFINIVESAFTYALNDKLYVWKHENTQKKNEPLKQDEVHAAREQYLPKISESKIHDIAWGLDVLDSK
ncbi:MAG: PrgI family protein [bacterium]